MHNLVFAQYFATAVSSAFNACYFFGYRSPKSRRRTGAVVLGMMSVAILIESLFFGTFSFYQEQDWATSFFLNPGYWLGARLLLCLASLLISVLILRHLISNRR